MPQEILINRNYPTVSDRVKAIFADTCIMLLFIVITTRIFSMNENTPDIARIIAFIFIFLLYDPIFTCSFGGTIGHILMVIRVKRENEPTMNIKLPHAILRFIGKILMGWISLITVTSNEKKRAIHDFICGSIVLYKQKPL